MNRKKLLKRLSEGALKNVAFDDFKHLIEGFGFELTRSHFIFSNPSVPELVNLQNVKREAKPYQIRQFLRLAERYDLQLEDDE